MNVPVRVKCFKGAEQICGYVNEDPKQICRLVKEENLPAWKRGGRGPWRAVDFDLDRWVWDQRNLYGNQPVDEWDE